MPTNRCHTLRGAVFARPRLTCAFARAAGFTLLEMLIVIGIIGILSAVLISQFAGATESARAAECLTHMRNLSNSVQNYAMVKHYYPTASDVEFMTNELRYKRHKGFISRYAANDPYAQKNGASSHQSLQTVSTYCTDPNQSRYCVTNGALWAYGGHKLDEYVCPSHRRFADSQGLVGPAWSYVMNPYFGYDYSNGAEATGSEHGGDIRYGECKRADKRLLFAELQWENCTEIAPVLDSSPTPLLDGVLHYDRDDWSGTKEAIGFNHKIGKKYVAHVCFADGHTEKLAMTEGGSSAALIELTKWLCDSDDIQYSNGKWTRTHDVDRDE